MILRCFQDLVLQNAGKAAIDAWLKANQNTLNSYGDAKDTAYAGGNPLFDMRTGKTSDVYSYVIEKHPSKPWNQDTKPPMKVVGGFGEQKPVDDAAREVCIMHLDPCKPFLTARKLWS